MVWQKYVYVSHCTIFFHTHRTRGWDADKMIKVYLVLFTLKCLFPVMIAFDHHTTISSLCGFIQFICAPHFFFKLFAFQSVPYTDSMCMCFWSRSTRRRLSAASPQRCWRFWTPQRSWLVRLEVRASPRPSPWVLLRSPTAPRPGGWTRGWPRWRKM